MQTAEDEPAAPYAVDGKTIVINDENASWTIDRKTYDIQRIDVARPSIAKEVAIEVPGETAEDWTVIKSFDRKRPIQASETGKDIKEEVHCEEADSHQATAPRRGNIALLSLGALGVVYGDIGTSPLYTVQTLFSSLPTDKDHIIGGISSLIWLLLLVVTFKYVVIVLTVDNRGEGGIMALTALAARSCNAESTKWLKVIVLFVGVLGTAMFYADSILTPAVSVLSALEGISVATPNLNNRTMPIAIAILFLLFTIQRFGTGFVGRMFGPMIILWFVMLAVSGIEQIVQEPSIFEAFNPGRAVGFLLDQSSQGNLFPVIGSIVLGVTGSECLYADMGHFGPLSIRLSWLLVVMPSLFLNYLGQGALLIRDPTLVDNPFFHMYSDNFLYLSVVMATIATIIASQAVISGTYSMTREAIAFGYLPRLTVRHTSNSKIGRIYVPTANLILGAAVLIVTGAYAKSANLANAYGLSVTMTMMVTSLLVTVVGVTWCIRNSRWLLAVPLVTIMMAVLTLDMLLLISCANKFLDGAWFPFAVAIFLFILMSTWAKGAHLLRDAVRAELPPLAPFLAWLTAETVQRSSRTAVYAVTDLNSVPPALVLNLRHHKSIHEAVIICKVTVTETPEAAEGQRIKVSEAAKGYWRVEAFYGFKEDPDIPAIIAKLVAEHGLPIDPKSVSYFLFRALAVPRPGSTLVSVHGMSIIRKWLFA
eukprot:CAMPEP_0113726134 /NCGR_PEP_ID=MMETSP0038_2-20120614/40223_1 /TAXON_ID=2898 /ORGANISM="Cryptomonas paramecium" /LENGTH=705 /DNA_ID=CAMNT_0000656627 /DNA_START=66 /DNA_END=2180 /DNA_ORIENTATION=+ /assembly_acc=CAM_ASM_000170